MKINSCSFKTLHNDLDMPSLFVNQALTLLCWMKKLLFCETDFLFIPFCSFLKHASVRFDCAVFWSFPLRPAHVHCKFLFSVSLQSSWSNEFQLFLTDLQRSFLRHQGTLQNRTNASPARESGELRGLQRRRWITSPKLNAGLSKAEKFSIFETEAELAR